MKAFVMDVSICNGCYSCQIGCKDEHCGNDWTPYAKPQPDTGQFWGRVTEIERGKIPHVRVTYTFIPCQHCVDAPCIAACPVEGGIYERDDGLVIIDPKKCTGCKKCVDACPYGTIYFNDNLNIAQKCTGCAHLLDRGWKEPRCVDNCPTGAIKFGDEAELDLSGAETLHPEYGLTTRVHYKNLPKRFIAGTVYTPDDEEVAIGATCTLTGEGGPYTQTTDGFGDFWFEQIPAADFTLSIEKDGKTWSGLVSTKEKDIGLGDIPLT